QNLNRTPAVVVISVVWKRYPFARPSCTPLYIAPANASKRLLKRYTASNEMTSSVPLQVPDLFVEQPALAPVPYAFCFKPLSAPTRANSGITVYLTPAQYTCRVLSWT